MTALAVRATRKPARSATGIRLAWGQHPNLRLTRLDGWTHKLSEIREHVLAAISD
jgi:hypothetical protein